MKNGIQYNIINLAKYSQAKVFKTGNAINEM